MTEEKELVLEGVDLAKDFVQGASRLQVLSGASIAVAAGERIAIVGASGSGKTTLLQLLGGLDLPTRGTVRIAGAAMNELSDAERGVLRNRAVGFVYQFHHLLPEFTALENVAMPLLVRRLSPREARAQAAAILSRVGLADRLTHRPAQLSGGERQRAAVARALAAGIGRRADRQPRRHECRSGVRTDARTQPGTGNESSHRHARRAPRAASRPDSHAGRRRANRACARGRLSARDGGAADR